jgi:hypothetical protein
MRTTITTRVGQAVIEIRDTIENLSASPTEMQMLYHVNYGPPLLGPGATVVAPIRNLVPRDQHAATGLADWDRYATPQAGWQEQVYFFDLQSNEQQQTTVLLKNDSGTRGASLQFDTRQLPCFTLWKNTIAEPDGYVTGLEPGTNYPNPRSFEGRQGRVVSLQPAAKCSFELTLRAHQTREEVEKTQQEIAALRKEEPTVHDAPQPLWCADA